MLELYTNIREYRKKKGLSQSELAQMVGYTDRSSIAKIEKGDVDLPQSKIILIADALGVNAGTLMGNTGITPEASLPSDEHTLLTSYRKLNDFGKKKAREDVEDLTYVPRYAKVTDPTLLQAAHQRTDIEIPEGVDTSDDKFFD